MKKIFLLSLLLLLANYSYATEYHVGPGQTFTEVGQAPWTTLVAGDIISIHWRSTPYPTKVFLRAQGTEANPVIIRGIPNAAGDLPILTGEDAITDAQFTTDHFDPVWTEHLSMFLIYRASTDNWNTYKPKHITFEYLEITGVKPEHTFTDQFGAIRNYSNFGTAIDAIVCENLTVRHCYIHHNSQGIFTNTNGGENQISRNLLIEYNEIGENGNIGDDRHHNIYAQAAGTIIQYNKITSLIPGSLGSSLKDRSSGTIIRYNWIETSARTIDLVESEDGYDIVSTEPDYHNTFVYGNVMINDITTSPFASSMIHFGHDNQPEQAKRGTMHFFNNTVYIKGDQSDYWYVNLFDVYDDNDAATDEASIDMYNNIIHKDGTTELRLMRDGGNLTFYENNWLQDDYVELGYGAEAIVTYMTDPILGTSPEFMDLTNLDFTLASSSSCLDIAGDLPANIGLSYPLSEQYAVHAAVVARTSINGESDLGAFEFANNPLAVDFLQFDVVLSQSKKTVKLEWKTASEINNRGFEIQKRNTFGEWPKIGWVAGKYNPTSLNKYFFIDQQPNEGINYYRLKQIDFDGQFEYSEIESINYLDAKSVISIFPNPTSNTINTGDNIYTNYRIFNIHGQLIQSGIITSDMDVSSLMTGTYTIKLYNKYVSDQAIFVKK